MRKIGYTPNNRVGNLTVTQVQTQIFLGNPIMVHGKAPGMNHELLIRGYHGSNYYSIWNPWNPYYETVSSGTVITSNGHNFNWYGTIDDFK